MGGGAAILVVAVIGLFLAERLRTILRQPVGKTA
jgi:hypothetical protein